MKKITGSNISQWYQITQELYLYNLHTIYRKTNIKFKKKYFKVFFVREHEQAIFLESNDLQILQKAEYNVGKVCPLNNHDSC